MSYDGTTAKFPYCGKSATTEAEIKEKFGYRDMVDRRIISQSYYRACRSAGCKTGEHAK